MPWTRECQPGATGSFALAPGQMDLAPADEYKTYYGYHDMTEGDLVLISGLRSRPDLNGQVLACCVQCVGTVLWWQD